MDDAHRTGITNRRPGAGVRCRRRYEGFALFGLVFGFGRSGFVLGFGGFLGLFDLVLKFGVEGLALLDGQLAFLDEALLNSGRQSTDAGEKNLAQAVTIINISHDVLL